MFCVLVTLKIVFVSHLGIVNQTIAKGIQKQPCTTKLGDHFGCVLWW